MLKSIQGVARAGLLVAAIGALALPAHADTGDTAWILTATALVLFMTLPGLALFYGGLVQAKNPLSIFMQCFAIACLVSLVWLVCGYSITFGPGATGYLGGFAKSMLANVTGAPLDGQTIPEPLFFMFQMTFAIITPALIVGAFVERVNIAAVLIFSALWLVLCYAPVVHWVWGGGWLAQQGVIDFAGGIVVHTTAGISALVFALMLWTSQPFSEGYAPAPQSGVRDAWRGACHVGHTHLGRQSITCLDPDRMVQLSQTHTRRRRNRHGRRPRDDHPGGWIGWPGRCHHYRHPGCRRLLGSRWLNPATPEDR